MKLADQLTSAHHPSSNGTASNTNAVQGGVEEGRDSLLKSVRFGAVTEEEARSAVEMMLVGSGSQVKPVIEWDGKTVGTGTVQYSTLLSCNV